MTSKRVRKVAQLRNLSSEKSVWKVDFWAGALASFTVSALSSLWTNGRSRVTFSDL